MLRSTILCSPENKSRNGETYSNFQLFCPGDRTTAEMVFLMDNTKHFRNLNFFYLNFKSAADISTVRKSWLDNNMGPHFGGGEIRAGRIRGAPALLPPLFLTNHKRGIFFASHASVQPHFLTLVKLHRTHPNPLTLPTCYRARICAV